MIKNKKPTAAQFGKLAKDQQTYHGFVYQKIQNTKLLLFVYLFKAHIYNYNYVYILVEHVSNDDTIHTLFLG